MVAQKFDNLNEMDQFLESHNLLKLTQKEIDDLNKIIYIKEMKLVINNLSKPKVPGLRGFTSEYYLKKKLYQFSNFSEDKNRRYSS